MLKQRIINKLRLLNKHRLIDMSIAVVVGLVCGYILHNPISGLWKEKTHGDKVNNSAIVQVFCLPMEDNSLYTGGLLDGERHEWGVLKSKNGNVYEGEWTNNRLTVGTLKFWNEEHGTYNKTWEGSFNKELQPHGFGKMDYGDSVYIGNYVNAFREGFGRILYKNGLQFFGRWRHGLKVNDSRLYATGDAVYGIDISAHQYTNGPIDWDKLAIFCDRQGNVYTAKADSEQYVRPVDFVFVRATVGADGKDSTYLENIRQAREHHLLVGSYHVFHLRSSVESQVDNYISLLKYESHDLPPVLDLETDTLVDHLKKMGLTQEQANGMMICWLKEVEDRLGRKPIVYVADRYYGDFIKTDIRFANYDFWIPRYASKEELNKNNKAQKRPDNIEKSVFWQMTERGFVSGIPRTVDIDRFLGTYDDFKRKYIQKE